MNESNRNESNKNDLSEPSALFDAGPGAASAPPAIAAAFGEFWGSYPRRVGKGDAEKAWRSATSQAPVDVILAGARRYADEVAGRDVRHIAHPATWLRGRRWEDDPDANRSRPSERPTRSTPGRDGSSGRVTL